MSEAEKINLDNISVDAAGLYREEMITDLKAASMQVLTPVKVDGSVDETCAPQVKDHLMGDGFSLSSDNGEHFVHHTIGAPRQMRTSTNGIFTVTSGLQKGAIQ